MTDNTVPNQHDQPASPTTKPKPMKASEMNPMQLKASIDAMEGTGIQKMYDLWLKIMSTPPDDPKEWQNHYRRAAREMDKSGPGEEALFALLLPRYIELVEERDARQQDTKRTGT